SVHVEPGGAERRAGGCVTSVRIDRVEAVVGGEVMRRLHRGRAGAQRRAQVARERHLLGGRENGEVRGVLRVALDEVVPARVDGEARQRAHHEEGGGRDRQDLPALPLTRAAVPHHSVVTTETVLTMMFGAKALTNGSRGMNWYWTSTATCLTVGKMARCGAEVQLLSGGLAVATAGQMYA